MNTVSSRWVFNRSAKNKPFRLVRYYSIASLLGIAVVTLALLALHHQVITTNFVEHESHANIQVTRLLANVDREIYEKLLAKSSNGLDELGPQSMHYRVLDVVLRERVKGLPVVKVKVYRPDGVTVYSTNSAQAGENQSSNPGFLAAMNHEVHSHLNYRQKFDAFAGTIGDRTLLSSYVPLNFGDAIVPQGVIEVYSDVTDLLAKQQSKEWQITGPIVSLLTALYLFLFGVVRRAESIIREKHAEGKDRELEAMYQARHDRLTGAKNRTAFSEVLPAAIEQALNNDKAGALLYLDLNDFKKANDDFGHLVGDALLIQVVRRVQRAIGPRNDLYRIGGDEFTVIAPEASTEDQVAKITERIEVVMRDVFVVNDHRIWCSASIGVAFFPRDGVVADEVMRRADLDMYKAKVGKSDPLPPAETVVRPTVSSILC